MVPESSWITRIHLLRIILGISLPKEAKDLYSENEDTDKRKKTNRWRDKPCSWTILLKGIYIFSVITIKLSMAFFTQLGQKNLQFVWKHKRPWLAKAVLRKKKGAGGIRLPDLRLRCKTTVIKSVTQINGTGLKDQRWSHTPMVSYSMTREARIYNGKKITSITGARKTGQVHIKEWNQNTP